MNDVTDTVPDLDLQLRKWCMIYQENKTSMIGLIQLDWLNATGQDGFV